MWPAPALLTAVVDDSITAETDRRAIVLGSSGHAKAPAVATHSGARPSSAGTEPCPPKPGTVAVVEYQALYRKYRPQTFDDVIGRATYHHPGAGWPTGALLSLFVHRAPGHRQDDHDGSWPRHSTV